MIVDRRSFLRRSLAGSGIFLAGRGLTIEEAIAAEDVAVMENMIGAYGPWASSISDDDVARLSFRNAKFTDVDVWRPLARRAVLDRLLQPSITPIRDVRIERSVVFDGLDIEHVSWQLSYGPRTRAVVLRPAGSTERLPGVLGLHDHGGNKFFGHEKITRDRDDLHPVMRRHQESDYGGTAWANELAKRGYTVLVHDTFTFGSRRVQMADVPEAARSRIPVIDGDTEADVAAYNRFASEHEHLMAKSLFSAGTTWPGVFTQEDQRALDYLASRPDVDAARLGCAGLSGGGLRTVYLGGIDGRIRCACCAGMMTTWRDYLLNKCHTHTWMIYIPGVPLDLDYPEVLGLRVPLPTLVLNNREDPLFTLAEMERADLMLAEVFNKAGAPDAYRASFYDGPHKFDQPMQQEAFDWFDRWLKETPARQ